MSAIEHVSREQNRQRVAHPQVVHKQVAQRVAAPSGLADYILHLQRTVGNRAVGQWLRHEGLQSPAQPNLSGAVTGGIHRTPSAGNMLQRATIANIQMTKVNQLKEYFDFTPKEGVETEIVARLLSTSYDYDTVDQFMNETRMRQHLIKAMERIHDPDVNVGYHHGGDTLKLPKSEFSVVEARNPNDDNKVAVKPDPNKPEEGAAFASKNKASAAIEAIFADKTEEYFLECNTATVAIHYKALLDTMGEEQFNELFHSGITITPEWLEVRKKHQGTMPSSELIPETTRVESMDDLIPGDWVYFVNFPDYEKKHPEGAFTGENALYLGKGMFRGFGVDSVEYDKMNEYLIGQYNKDLPKGSKKAEREKSKETLDGFVPGIVKGTVRRIMENERIRTALISELPGGITEPKDSAMPEEDETKETKPASNSGGISAGKVLDKPPTTPAKQTLSAVEAYQMAKGIDPGTMIILAGDDDWDVAKKWAREHPEYDYSFDIE